MKTISCSAFVLAVAAMASFTASAAAADHPDGCTVGPTHCKILKQDGKVRVIDYTAKAGDKIAMHSHPAHVVYTLQGGKTKFTMADGTVKEVDMKPGDTVINPATVHAVEHMGDVHVIMVEMSE